MAGLMSFAITTRQVRARLKDVTRRLGWKNLTAGTILQAVVKSQGLKLGERVERICFIRVVSVRRERLDAITPDECRREGFPEMSPAEFVAMFCEHNKCLPSQIITRIEFAYI
jgi:hypothetical protein